MTAAGSVCRHRREFVAAVVAGTAGSLVGCAGLTPAVGNDAPRALKRPSFALENIAAQPVGFRPYRRGGFVVSGEWVAGKWLHHNYGHGGAGITLGWGTSMLVALELQQLDPALRQAAVLGRGVVGLSTARILLERGWQVRLYARDEIERTTSFIAGGQFAPTSVVSDVGALDRVRTAQLAAAMRASFQHFSARVSRAEHGVRWQESFHLSDFDSAWPDHVLRYPEMYPDAQALAAAAHPFNAAHVLAHRGLFIEPPIYLRQLESEVRTLGGAFVQRSWTHLSELATLAEPVVINCLGLGAKTLVDDSELMPVRGQLVHLPPDAQVNYATHGGSNRGLLYMFPRQDALVLGGTFERNDTRAAPEVATTDRIVRGHAALFRASEFASDRA